MDTKELLERIEKDNVKFISLQFTDVSGTVKSVDMPVRKLKMASGLTVHRWRDLRASKRAICA